MTFLTKLIGWPLAVAVTFMWFCFCLLGMVASAIDFIAGYGMEKTSSGVFRSIELISGNDEGGEWK